MTGVADWKAALRTHLDQLAVVFEQRFGYPFDEESNFVSDADQELPTGGDATAFPPALADFYAEVGEVSLPDVNNGYFIHPADRLPVAADWGLPTRVDVGSIGEVATFGSDGGGGFFCLARHRGVIFHLPPGRVDDGVYTGGLGDPRLIADDFEGFLARILVVIGEFVASGATVEL
ncbi:hypothetical protein HDA40_008042 [Hamadaea flava]|uniref:Knr4/Smi1-like domain-containing protein n=1 Tax=Hamadaea flava TaxID=1742688 RepID=A0ABV8LN54_9ACTN|nr:hypothetical protein [Hamadaea flava]MCP2329535.1 hypothetical protein [Hamadaea flava]